MASQDIDVAIIGGGPAGSTTGTLLKKYGPDLRVRLFERELFPRDHIGESLLPPVSAILDEMGIWDKVEAANFPIKIGSTNRWGKKPELWDLEFIPCEEFVDEVRPASFLGQRRKTAFQVDRAVYDKILLDHARDTGVQVCEESKVVRVQRDGDRVTSLELESGESVAAEHYVDASGHSGVLRRSMGVDCEYPTSLQNIALWDYWQNAEWAVKIGIGGTKIQVRSLGYGWIWFIPLGPTRTSIGLVVPASYYKASSKNPEQLYWDALQEEPEIVRLTANADREGKFSTTKDWSFLASRQSGENWFLVGESSGFADPILSAGVTMAHAGGRELAFTILEILRSGAGSEKAPAATSRAYPRPALSQERGDTVGWLKEQYDQRQARRILSHIRFADFWYTSNAQFSDIKEFTQQLAHDVGLDMTPERAWEWLARGGFVDEDLACGIGGFGLGAIKAMSEMMTDLKNLNKLEQCNVFKLNLEGATWKNRAIYRSGGVHKSDCYIRGENVLPLDGAFGVIVNLLQRSSDMAAILSLLQEGLERDCPDPHARRLAIGKAIQAFDGLISDGWIDCSHDPDKLRYRFDYKEASVRWNRDTAYALQGSGQES